MPPLHPSPAAAFTVRGHYIAHVEAVSSKGAILGATQAPAAARFSPDPPV
jgi:hypothetical protein